MPRSPAERPVPPPRADRAALEAAGRQARERSAAPASPGVVPEPERPGSAPRVKGSEPVRGATVQGRTRGARSHVLAKKGRRKREEPSAGAAAPDPRGRGTRVDLEI